MTEKIYSDLSHFLSAPTNDVFLYSRTPYYFTISPGLLNFVVRISFTIRKYSLIILVALFHSSLNQQYLQIINNYKHVLLKDINELNLQI